MKEILSKILKWGSLGLFLVQTLLSNDTDGFKLVPLGKEEEKEE